MIYTIHGGELKRSAKQCLSGRLLDIGCGSEPYRDLLALYVTKYVGVDRTDIQHQKSNVYLFGTAYEILAEDAAFDSAICSALLEHLEEPELAIRECYPSLEPNGFSIYTVSFIWHIDEGPRDFYRCSKYGREYLFEEAGFEVLEIKALSGFWGTFGPFCG